MEYRQFEGGNQMKGMVESRYNGLRVRFSNGHPHAGETGEIIGRANTIAGDGWVVKIDGTEQECFFFKADDIVFLPRKEKK
jgi:hypothetical protein